MLDTQPSAETCRVWLRRDSKHIVIMRLLIEGPSSAEAMRGTTMGLPNDKHAGTPAIVQKHYGHLRTAALSLAGWLQLSLLLSNVPIGLNDSCACLLHTWPHSKAFILGQKPPLLVIPHDKIQIRQVIAGQSLAACHGHHSRTSAVLLGPG